MTTIQSTSIIDLHAEATPIGRTHSETLLDSCGIKVIRIEVPAGGEIPRHSAQDQATLQCLAGNIVVGLDDDELRLSPGQLIFLDAHQPHAVRASSDSVLLITLRIADPELEKECSETNEAGLDAMDQTAKESFPASDPPGWTLVTGP